MFSSAEDKFSGNLFLEHFSPYINILPQIWDLQYCLRV